MSARVTRCECCRTPTRGCLGLCRTCKFAHIRGASRIQKEGLLVDTAGGSWWVWTPKGEVLVIGRDTKTQAVIALDQDPVSEAP